MFVQERERERRMCSREKQRDRNRVGGAGGGGGIIRNFFIPCVKKTGYGDAALLSVCIDLRYCPLYRSGPICINLTSLTAVIFQTVTTLN